jgi:SM-20-related protein
MLDFSKINNSRLNQSPFQWAEISNLYSSKNGSLLAGSYPMDHYRTVEAYGGEKDYFYEARSLIGMGAKKISYAEHLSTVWQEFAIDLLSDNYRNAMTNLTGVDLMSLPMEVNLFHYGPGALLGPHCDLPEKIVTHIFYFNEHWHPECGGQLAILNSADSKDTKALVPPIIGNSAAFIRSNNSWHEVTKVSSQTPQSRRSVTVTFYQKGSESSMWPTGEKIELHDHMIGANIKL